MTSKKATRGKASGATARPPKNPPKSPRPPQSAAVEDYLETILQLIDTKGYARVIDIAAGLGISQASVTNMVQRMDAGGLLKYEKYRGLTLTAEGRRLGENITHRHSVLTEFLRMLGLPEDIVYRDVEGMEHHISPTTVAALVRLNAHLKSSRYRP
ncbi:MAG TPA: transcriptional regulator MntR [Verrucomicrobiales bacterium]|jgi:Mn-dependent DtxR family transcriptional regulator|nr:transcriptional regulator MntR [Verrucomicrobiales bacterium]